MNNVEIVFNANNISNVVQVGDHFTCTANRYRALWTGSESTTFQYTYNGSGGWGTDTKNFTVSKTGVHEVTVSGVSDGAALTPTPSNTAPGGMADSYSIGEDATLTVPALSGVLHNDTDAEGDSLTAVKQSDPSHGTLTFGASNDGSFTYVPDADYNGQDSFTYVANDGQADSNPVTVTISVHAENDAPVAQPDSYNIPEDTPLNVDAASGLLDNDSDPEGNHLSALKISEPAHGTLVLNINGSLEYTPDADFVGDDSFTYKANDGHLDSAVAKVSIHVSAVNDAPIGIADSYNAHEDTGLTINAAKGVLNNDRDPEHSPLTVKLGNNVSHGTLKLNPDGSFDYTPALNYSGADSFTYQVSDGQLDSGSVTVNLMVDAVNDAPVANDDAYSVGEDGLLKVNVAQGMLANDQDADGDALRISKIVSNVSNGALHMKLDGSFTYKPVIGFSGTDSFTYQANDGAVDSNEVTVTLTVNPTNHPPLPNSDAYTIPEDGALSVTVAKAYWPMTWISMVIPC